MSDIVIALLLIVPIVIVIAILNNGHKKRKKSLQNKLSAFLHEVMEQHGIVPGFQKQLVHQLMIVDEKSRKFLIVNHHQERLTYDLFHLDDIKNVKVVNHKQTLMPDDKSKKPESFTTQIGVTMVLEKSGAEKFLTLYDHVEHNIYHMAEMETEAGQLSERIKKTLNSKPIEV